MGIVHLCGLGRNPGAVTVGLSYIYHNWGEFGRYGRPVEKVIILTSREIAEGYVKAGEVVYNHYGRGHPKGIKFRKSDNALEIVREFIEREFGDVEIWRLILDVNDFSQCVEYISKTVLYFHSEGGHWKHIWANITGGTNPLNSAIVMVAHLSGAITMLYYTFISKREYFKYLNPFTDNKNEFDFRRYYIFKTDLDRRYIAIMEVLNEVESIKTENLLSRLKKTYWNEFNEFDEGKLRKYLITMIGVNHHKDCDTIMINDMGRKINSLLNMKWLKALTGLEKTSKNEIEDMKKEIGLEKIYP